ncbi:O-antigen ligase family protein [Patescibacteria group bacterium]|nr:O-antigen ligase family protein [Patescibacteria group bacterium]MBU4022852.1 O-antigen ligase family protein [Patescibacteria group bacterium]MBU4162002.1 O-antigen ligase family protein [Patescibacteria group bacterium]
MGKKSREKKERRSEQTEEFIKKQPKGAVGGLEKICLFILYSSAYLMLLIPLIVSGDFLFPFVGPKGLYLMALIEIFFATGIFLIIYSPKYRAKHNALSFAIGFFVLVMILSTIFGADPLRSFWSKFERMSGLLMWLHLFGFFIVSRIIFKKDDWLRIFSFSILVSMFVCLLFWLNKAGMQGLSVAYNGSTVGNSSFLATYLLFNLFFAIYLFFELKKRKIFQFFFIKESRKICLTIATTGFVFMLITLLFSTGRAAILAFFGGAGLLLLLYLALEHKKNNIRLIAKICLILGLVIYLSGLTMLLWSNSPVQQWLSERANKSRQVIWSNAWQGFSERPILGWGSGNFSFVFHKHFDPGFYIPEIYGADTRFDRAHNIIFDNLVDGGALGLFGYLSMFGTSFWILRRGYKRKKLDFITAAVPSVILVAHFTQNLTVFDMPASFLMLFISFSFISVVSCDEPAQEVILAGRKKGRIIFLPLIALLFFFSLSSFVIKPAIAGTATIRVMKSSIFEAREPLYEKALHSSPMGQYQIREHLGLHIFNLIEARLVETRDFEIVTEALEESVQNSPFDYYERITLARTYNAYSELQKEKDEIVLKRTEEVLEDALRLSPTKQEGYWEMATTKSMLNKNDEASELLEKAISLDPRVLRSYQMAIVFYKKIGDIEKARQKGDELLKYYPELESSVRQALDN